MHATHLKTLYALFTRICSTIMLLIMIISVSGVFPVSAAPAGTALQFNGTSQYVTFGKAGPNSGYLMPSATPPAWQTSANSKLGNSALSFNGAQYVSFGPALDLGAQNFTVETWFIRTGTGTSVSTGSNGITLIPLVTKGAPQAEGSNVDENYVLGIRASDNVLAADFETYAICGSRPAGDNNPLAGVTPITNDVWYHAAVTYDGAAFRLYLNGNLENTLVTTCLPRYDSIQYAALGTTLTSTGTAAGYFLGRLDEARVWNVAHTQSEIQATMNSEVTTASGLIGRWGMNEGTGKSVLDSAQPAKLGVSTFTIETWINWTGGGITASTGTGGITAIPLVTKGVGEADGDVRDANYFLGISGGKLAADFEDTATGLNHPITGATTITTGTWHHVAATYDGQTWRLYLDGAEDASLTVGTFTPAYYSIQHAGLGTAINSTGVTTGYFAGIMDETRIWNVARTPTEIQTNRYKELTSGTGLVGRWGMNEGSGTIINDAAIPTPENGTLMPTATPPTWVAGFQMPPAAPTGLAATSYSSNVSLSWTANVEADLTGYNLYRATTAGGPYTKVNSSLITSTAYTDGNLTNGTPYYYVVKAVNSSSLESAASGEISATPLLSQGAAVQFDGVNDYVTFGAAPGLGAQTFTLETWFNWAGGGVTANTGSGGATGYPLITKGLHEADGSTVDANYFLGITTTGNLTADFEEYGGGQNYPVTGSAVVTTNTWHHAAVTYDGQTWKLYLDGALDISLTLPAPHVPRYDSIQHAGIGVAMNSTGVTEGAFAGKIDEARIWNRALTPLEIQTNINSQLTSGTGLLARWGMNEGTGIVIASSVGSFNGTLTNGPLWVPGAPFNITISTPTAPDSLSAASPSSNLVNLTWADKSNNETNFELERGNDLAGPFTPLITLGANVTSYADATVLPSIQYCYRVRATNVGGQSTYSNVSCVTPVSALPTAPTGLNAAAPNYFAVNLGWTDNSNNETGFEIERSTTGSGGPFSLIKTAAADAVAYADTNVQPSTNYCYQVRAVNGAGQSSYTSVSCATTPVEGDYGLQFDGVNDYVTFGAAPGLGVQTFTIETWFNWAGGGITANTGAGGVTAYPLITKGLHEADGSTVDANYFLGITTAGNLTADFEEYGGGQNYPVTGNTVVTTNVWHHVAATYDGQTWKLYLDGVLDTSLTLPAPHIPRYNSIQHAGIGTAMNSTGVTEGAFAGKIDEVRIWNVAHSQAEIRSTINSELTSGTGLLARWGMNEGTGIIMYGPVGTFPGTLTNGPIWTSGAPFNIDFTPPAAPNGLAGTSLGQTINLTWTANTDSDLAGYNIYRSTTPGVPLSSPLNGGSLLTGASYTDPGRVYGTTYYYVVTAVDTSHNQSSASNEVYIMPSASNGAAIQYDGVNDYVTFGSASGLGVQSFTLESWIKRTGAGATVSTGSGGVVAVPLITKGRCENDGSNVDANYFFGIDAANKLVADFEDMNTGLNHPITGTVTVPADNTWHHVAVTYDQPTGVWNIYLDGVLGGTATVSGASAVRMPRSDSIQHAALGTALDSTGSPTGTCAATAGYFAGVMDEARIWNRAVTPLELQTNINSELTSGTGLLARWGLNEGSGLTAGSSIGTFNGALTNGPLWVLGAPFNAAIPAPTAPNNLNASAFSPTRIDLSWTDNSNNETGFEIQRSTTGSGGPFNNLNLNAANVTTYSDTSVTASNQYCYRVYATGAGSSSGYSEVACVTPPQGGSALKLGSAGAYVVFPNSSSLNTATFTIETWFRRDGVGVAHTTGNGGTNLIPLIAKGTAEDEFASMDINYALGINPAGNLLCADFEESQAGAVPSQNHPVCGTTPIQTGVWYHAAATYNGTTWQLYLDGMPEATLAVGQPANAVNTAPVSLGTGIQSDGITTQGSFDGTLEEVRIWNYARSMAQVRTTINSQITAGQSGLIARWGLNTDTGATINGSAGTTVNGTVMGTGYSWVTPGAPFNISLIPPVAPSSLTATATSGYTMDLSWTDNSSNEIVFEIERGSDLVGPFFPLASVGLNTTTYTDSYVVPQTQYCYRVRANNPGGPSSYSNAICATTLSENGAALKLGSANAYVTFPNAASLNTPTFTLETWFRRDGAGVANTTGNGGTDLIPLIAKGTAESETANADINYTFGINPAGNFLCADFEEAQTGATPGQNHPICGTTAIQTGIWYHAAATYDGTTWQIYLNGMPEATLVVGQPANAANIVPASLGTGLQSSGTTPQGFFDGTLDEARIWNYARSLAQVRTTINTQIDTAQSGLIARWSLNESAGTVVHGSAGTSVNGPVMNTGYSWVTPGAPFNISFITPIAPSGLTATAASAYDINLAWTDNSDNEATFVIERGATSSGPFTVLTNVSMDTSSYTDSSAVPLTQYCYRVHALNPGGASSNSNVACATTLAESPHALRFGTANAYAKFPNASSLNTATFTVETWFRRDGTGTAISTGTGGTNLEPLIAKGTAEAENANADINYIFGINPTGNLLCADFEESQSGANPSLNHPVCGTTAIVNGTWYHAAATYNGSVWNLYLNGKLEATLSVGQPSNALNISPLSMGTSVESNGVTTAGYFNGTLDEVRIWNTARNLAEIRSTIDLSINTPTTGLLGRWGLDESAGAVVHATAGTTVGGAVTGTGYSWVSPGAPFNIDVTPPAVPAGLIATPGVNSVSLGWTANTEPDLAGYYVYRSTTSPVVKGMPLNGSLLTSPAYVDSTAIGGTTYYYAVSAVDTSANESALSTEVLATALQPAFALDFGSGTAYVTFGDPAKLDLATFTIETWFKRTGTGTPNTTGSGGINVIPLVTHGAAEADGSNVDANWILAINSDTNTIAADFEDMATGLNHPVSGTTVITNNVWHHGAATYDGTTWRLYLDGRLEATLLVNATPRSDSIQRAALGAMLTSTGTRLGHFQGVIDEARVWNVARTQTQLIGDINHELYSGTGLVARWGLNEGTGTVVGDSLPTPATGTITNTGWSWVAGAPFNITGDTIAPAAPTGLTATPGNGMVSLTWTANSETDLVGYNVYRSTTTPVALTAPVNNGGPVTTTAYVDTGLTNGTTYYYVITAVDAWGNESLASTPPVSVIPILGAGAALDFGSGNAYVTFGDPAKLDLATFTIETWFKRTGTGTSNTTGTGGINVIPLVTHGAPEAEGSSVDANWILAINSDTNTVAADFEDMATGANHPVSGTTVITNNIWHHAAATYDGTTWRLFLDGNLETTLVVNQTPRSDTTQKAGLGTMLTTAAAPLGHFQGVLDEARVWNRALPQSELRANINLELTSGSGLAARWGMNEGSGTVVGDSLSTPANGTITNTGWSWTMGAPFNLNFAPNVPSLVSPANAATNVPIPATLSVNVSDPQSNPLTVSFYGRPKNGTVGSDFTLIVIPDPQYYAASYPSIYNAQMQWVANNKAARNIVFAASMGDNVDTYGTQSQWDTATAAFDLLTAGSVPYGTALGNHDGAPAATANFNTNFGDRIALQPTYGGRYGSDYDNTFSLFQSDGLKFIVVFIELDDTMTSTTHPVLVWANSLLQTYSDRRAIVVTHNLLQGGISGAWTPQGQTVYNALRGNSNFFLMLGGHLDTAGRRTDIYNGNTVYSLRSDYQFVDNQQSGYLRIMRFSPVNNLIYVTTYSPTQNKENPDTANNTFTLPYTMANSTAFTLIGTDSVASGSNASVTWPGLASGTEYEWYAVSSDGSLSATSPTWSFTTELINRAPICSDAILTTNEDTTGQTDPSCVDADGNPLTYSVTQPAHGTTSVVAGKLNYVPTADYSGTDSFTYKANDGSLDSNTATVTVTVTPVNDLPTLNAIPNPAAILEDAGLQTVNLSGISAGGGESQALQVTASSSNTGLIPNPTVTYTSPNATGSLAYTPVANQNGSAIITVTVRDAGLDGISGNADDATFQRTFTVTVTAVNDPPVITGQSPLSTPEDTALTITLANLTVTDPDNTYPTDFTLTVLAGTNYTFIGNTITPALNFNGTLTVPVKVNDGLADSNTYNLSVTVTPVNDPPVITGQLPLSTPEDTALTIVLANLTVTDPDNTYPTGFTLTVLAGSNYTFVGNTITPALNFNGTLTVPVKVNDGTADSNTYNLTVTVTAVNDAPTATAQSVTTAEDTAKAIVLTGFDLDGDTLTFAIGTGPTHGTLTGTAPTVTYTPTANYNGPDSFTFTVDDGTLTSAPATVSITVTAVNDAPTATAQSVTTAEDTAKAIVLTGFDLDGDALTFAIGSDPIHGTLTGTAPNVTYTPAANYNGPDSFTFTVDDGTITSAPATVSITVTAVNDPPVITGQLPLSTPEDTALTITLANLTVTDPDNTYPTGFTLTVLAGSNYTFVGNTITPALNFNGTLTVPVKVNDGTADSNTFNLTVTVTPVNDPPVITGQLPLSTPEDTALTIALANLTVTDPDNTYPTGFTLTVLAGSNYTFVGNTITPALNFNGTLTVPVKVNDGTADSNTFNLTVTVTAVNDAPTATAQSVTTAEDTAKAIVLTGSDPDGDTLIFSIGTGPTHGTLTGTAPNVTYTPAANYNGPDSFTFTVDDGTVTSAPATVSITVTPVNDPPTATAQSITTAEDTAKAIVLTGSDPDGDALTFAIGTGPTHGTLTGTAPNVTYTPAANYNGPDSFTFTVNDGLLTSAPATVSITVTPVNDPPVITEGALVNLTMSEDGSPIAFNLTLNATDPDAGDTLTWSIATAALHGTAAASGTGSAKIIDYVPAANYNGTDTFVVQVADGNGGVDTITVNVTILAVNDAPVANTQSVSTTRNTPKPITLTGLDVDGDPLTFTVVSNPTHGTLSGIAPNVTYTPALNYIGLDSFTFKVNDGTVDSNIATVSINVNFSNVPPVANDQSVTTPEDIAIAITLAATDADGDTLIYSIVTPPAHGTLSGTAPNVTYTPDANYNGADSFTFKANDSTIDSNVSTVSITVTPVNDPPTLNVIPDPAAIPEDALLQTVNLSGISAGGGESQYLQVTSSSSNTGLIPNPTVTYTSPNITGSLAYTPVANQSGTAVITVSVRDAGLDGIPNNVDDATFQRTFTVTVTAVNDLPTLNAIPDPAAIPEDAPLQTVNLSGISAGGGESQPLQVTSSSSNTGLIPNPTVTYTSANATGSLAYTPVANQSGSAVITVTVRDAGLDGIPNNADDATFQRTFTVTVTPVNDPPVITGQLPLSTPEDTALTIALANLTVTDPDNTYPTGFTLTVLAGTNYTFVGNTITPALNFTGTLTVPVKVNDGAADSNTFNLTVTVTAVNDLPVITGQLPLSTPEDTALTIALANLTVTDPDNTYPTGFTLTVLAGSNYTFVGNTITPALNFNGTLTVPVKVNDGLADSNTFNLTVTVTAVNDPPVITGQSLLSTPEDTALTIALANLTVTDPDNTYPTGFSLTVLAGSNYTFVGNTITPALNFNGTLTVPVKVNDGAADSNTFNLTVTVTAVNDPPVANNQSVSTTRNTPKAIILTATDVDGGPLTFTVVSNPTHGTLSGTAPNVTYTPAANYVGTDSFTFKANDSTVDSNIATVSITVNFSNVPPVANDQSVTTAEDTAIAIILAATDADGDTLVYNIVTPPAHGTLSGIAPNVTYTPAANYNGADSFTFKANDSTIDSNVATVSITVSAVNDPPVITGQLPLSTPEDTALTIALANLTVTDPDNTYPTGFTLTVLAGSNYTFVGNAITPALNFNGTLTVPVKVNDGTADSNTYNLSVTVTAVNDPPVITGQSLLSTPEDTALTIALANLTVTDPDNTYPTGFTLTVLAGSNYTFVGNTITSALNFNGTLTVPVKVNDGLADSNTYNLTVTVTAVNDPPVANNQSVSTTRNTPKAIILTATDVDGGPLTFTVVSNPTHGTLTGTAPNVTYTPAANYTGPDSFTFKANDSTADSNIATVSITVNFSNVPPFANDQSVSTTRNTPKAIILTATDADGDTLTYSIVTPPAHGTLTGTAPNVTYTPVANYTGADSFTFKANDSTADSNIATVSITVNFSNVPPVANDQSVSTTRNTPQAIILTATDVDGDTLTYSIVTPPAHGTLSGIAPNVTYTPDANYTGPDSFTFQANDGTADSNIATVSITVNFSNVPPVANDQSVSTTRNTPKTIILAATDADGDALTYAILSAPTHGTLSGTAPNVTYVPDANYTGPDSFTFKANDSTADSNIATVSITVNFSNVPPVANDQSVSTSEDTAIAIILAATDADGDTLAYSIVTPPEHGTLSGIAPNATYTPAANYNGADSFTFKANDSTEDSNIATVSITVIAVNDPPVANNQSITTPEDTAIAITLAATDADGDTLVYNIVTPPAHGTLSGTAPNVTYTPAANYAGADSFTFKANDSTEDSNIATVSITVSAVNNPPTNISLSKSSVDENQLAGTVVGGISTTDPDLGDTFVYTFCGGADDASFQISGSNLQTASMFDYETRNSYSICIRSTDSGLLFFDKTFTITVHNLVDTTSFADVPASYWAWQYIERLYSAGLTNGCGLSPLIYCPDSMDATRAQMAIFLLRGIHGSSYIPPAVGDSTGFSDVATTYWDAAWIKQLAVEGITSGCGPGIYCPDESVTRAQIAIFLLRAEHGSTYVPPNATGTVFNDVPTGSFAAAWIEQLAREGITSGCGPKLYCPAKSATRAEMAVFLVRAFNLP